MDGIIFDVDGTLWDSVEVVAESWNLAIKENSDLEPNLNREILQGLFGKTMDEIAAGVFPDLDPDSRRKLMDICFDYENRYLETHPGVYYEGVMDTLKELALEYPLFIVSNCQCGYIEVMMKGAGMEPYIKDFLCFGQTQTSKDQTILKLMEKNNLTSLSMSEIPRAMLIPAKKPVFLLSLLNMDLEMLRKIIRRYILFQN